MKVIFAVAGIAMLLGGCAGAIVAAGASGASMAADRRTAGTILDDQSIEIKVRNHIFNEPAIKEQVHLSVTSYNGVVLLTGEAPKPEQKERMGQLASEVEKVRRVVNEVAVMEPTPMNSRTQDTWITTKVKTRLSGDSRVSPFHVKVVTENRIVYLMGLVTREEGDAAAEQASQVEGVARVVKVFEYID